MCSLISQRGLSERLEQFCSSLLPLGSTEPLKWVKRLSDEGIISAIAWLHIYGARSLQEISRSTTLYESSAVIDNTPVGSNVAVRLLSAHNLALELNCGTQTSQITSLSTIVSLPQLALDALTLAAHENYSSRSLNPEDSLWTQDPWNEVPHILQAILDADSSLSTISHVAVVVAAMERMICSNLRSELWYYPTEEDQERLGRLITELARVIHKKQIVESCIGIALSLVDGNGDEGFAISSVNIHYILLTLTKEVLQKTPPRGIMFYGGLLRLSRVYSRHVPTQDLVLELLSLCEDCKPLHDAQYKADVLRLFKHGLSATSGYQSLEDPNAPLYKLSYQISIASSDEMFFHIFPTALSAIAIDDSTPFSLTTPRFIRHRALCSNSSKSIHPRIAYGYQVALALITITHQQSSKDNLLLTYFLSNMMQDTELNWPAYFPSPRIEAIAESYGRSLDATRYTWVQGSQAEENELCERISSLIQEHRLEGSWSGGCTMVLWRAACNAFREGQMPDNWNDAAFFGADVVGMMINYYHHVKQQQCVGVDWDTLRSYFKKAVGEEWEPEGLAPEQQEFGGPQTSSVEETSHEARITERSLEIRSILNDLGSQSSAS
ncbi:hypothetical protein FRC02_004925 [Tulasnella sp. 418]|nr:hypothetical protein FRC02_004925 [Tulasnella sp. 418]